MAEKAKVTKVSVEEFEKEFEVGEIIEFKSTGLYKDTSLEGRVRAIVTDPKEEFSLEVLVHEKHAVDLAKGMSLAVEYSGIYTSPNTGRRFINSEAIWSF